jgi:hypothetical protein
MVQMRRLIVISFIAISALLFTFSVNAGDKLPYCENSRTVFQKGNVKLPPRISRTTEDNYIYVRVLINGRWWTYIYTSDGSFVVAIPDEDP